MPNEEVRIRLQGRLDRTKKEFYLAFTTIPALVDLSNACVLFFPDEESDTKFGGDLVIRHRDDRKRITVSNMKPEKEK